jgi:hypothetical protein
VASRHDVGDGEHGGGDGDEQGDKPVHERLLRGRGCSDRLAGNLTPGARGVNILSESGVVELYSLRLYELGR